MRLITSGIFVALSALAINNLPAPSEVAAQNQLMPYDDPKRVLVIYGLDEHGDLNGNGVNDSEEIAKMYALERGVPIGNLLGLDLWPREEPGRGGYHWTTPLDHASAAQCQNYHERIVNPVRAKLRELGETNIDYIVSTLYMPDTATSISIETILSLPFGFADTCDKCVYLPRPQFPDRPFPSILNPYLELSAGAGKSDKGHFTHALTQVHSNQCRAPGKMNPGKHNLYLTTRLGAGRQEPDETRDQVHGALYAEKYYAKETGYFRGTNYIDVRYFNASVPPYNGDFSQYPRYFPPNNPQEDIYSGYGSYEATDKSIFQQVKTFADLNLPYKYESNDVVIGAPNAVFNDGTSALRASEAMFYGGWYSWVAPAFDWLPGSAGIQLESGSCKFIAQEVNSGLTAGACVTNEPYTTGHVRPEIFTYYLTHGYNFAESAWAAIPFLHWANMVIGDPLYRPLKDKPLVKDTVFAKDLITADGSKTCTYWAGCAPLPTATDCSTTHNIEAYLAEGAGEELADFKLEYGTSAAFGSTVDFYSKGNYRFSRKFFLQNLAPGTTYFYKVSARDPLGNALTSAVKQFTTCSGGSNGFTVTMAAKAQTITAGGTVQFDASTTCANCAYRWKLGAEPELTGKAQSKRFDAPGTYDIFVTAERNGIRAMDRGIVFVLPGSPGGQCSDGQTRQCGATDVGECSFGSATCAAGTWGACAGEVKTAPEICDNKDNDCDGQIDEDILCASSPLPSPTASATPAANGAPLITVNDIYQVIAGDLLDFAIIVSDPEGEAVTLNILDMTLFPGARLE